MVGYVMRLGLYNPGANAVVVLKDSFTPDSSNGVPTPTIQTPSRYTASVPPGDFVDIDGKVLSKHLGLLNINSTVAGVIASFILELK
jgi:hypothetical protein